MGVDALLRQVNRYRQSGVGVGGALLKHSLCPIRFLTQVLPHSGTILDLGCGEGMLTNLLAVHMPGAGLHGVDRDPARIRLAQHNAPANASFATQDINKCCYPSAAAAIYNDVLHHHGDTVQSELLAKAFDLLDEDGVLILKEVDLEDRMDRCWTSFWDQRLYPHDQLNFHSRTDWERLLYRAGFRLLTTRRVGHPWPASRTIMVATKRPKHPSLPVVPNADARATVRVLVTGGTGFIGQHLVRELQANSAQGSQVVEIAVLVRDPDKLPREWREDRSHIRILQHDLTQLSSGTELRDFDYVFHLAANVDFFADQSSAQENVTGTVKLLRAVSCPRLKRFVLASTVGAIDRSPNDNCTRPLDEQTRPHPVSKYGRSKLDCENAVKQSGLPHTIVRVPWCYGPGMAQRHHVRSLFEKNLCGSLLLKIDWPGRVSVVEVHDLAKILWHMVAEPRALNETFFVSDGTPVSFGKLFRLMGEITGRKAGYLRIPAPMVYVLRGVRRFLPFQLKCLLLDALTVSTDKLKSAVELPVAHQTVFLLPLARYIHQDLFPGRSRTQVLITGAASGIGKALAEKCYAAGYRLLLVDCNAPLLQELGARLETEVLVADLSRENAVDTLSAMLTVAGQCPDILINNAGIGRRNAMSALETADLVTLLATNCAAPMKLTHVFIKESLRRKNGTVINMGSSAAFQPLPYMAVYSASKAFLVNLSEAIGGELQANDDRGAVEIITVIPSGVATGFQEAAGVKRKSGEKLLAPEVVAQTVLDQIGHGSRTIIIGLPARLMELAARILPRRWQVRLWQHMMQAMR